MENVLVVAANAQDTSQPLTVLLHELLKLWPLWVLVGLVAIGKEVLSVPAARRSGSRSQRRRTVSHRSSGSSSPLPQQRPNKPQSPPPGPRPGGLTEIDAMSGTQFEKRLESLFVDLGYAVRHTGRLGDFGADLVIERDGQKTAVQAKRHTNQVGLSAVREVLGAKGIYACDGAIVVTNSTFTWRAKRLADANGVELWDRMRLVSVLDDANSGGRQVSARLATDEHCARCGSLVSSRVRDYCHAHGDRFGGLTYCFEHQKQFPAST